MRRCLIIFAKEPEIGMVKTRLQKSYSRSFSLSLYKAFLKDTVDLTRRVVCKTRVLAYMSAYKKPCYLKKIAPDFIFYEQKGRHLGQRMYNAFRYALKGGSAKAVIIGSDSPNLPPSFIEKAFRRLSGADLVLGPSTDGGYYLIGMKRPSSGLFKGIRWGTSGVLRNTVMRAKRLKKRVVFLDEWYDVDEIRSLSRLRNNLREKRNKEITISTRSFLLHNKARQRCEVRLSY